MEKNNPTMAELLARKRQLTELRDVKLKSYRKRVDDVNENKKDSPVTPLPEEKKIHGNPATPITPTSLLRNIMNDSPMSPLPVMSPATQELYDVLITDPKLQIDNISDIIENSNPEENDVFEDSDDSVRDPDYELKNVRVDESETDCESFDGKTIEDGEISMSILEENNIETNLDTTPVSDTHNKEIDRFINNKKVNEQTITSKINIEESSSTIMRVMDYQNAVNTIETPTIVQENTIVALTVESTGSGEDRIKKGRSRIERNLSKLRRNTGKSYITEKGKEVKERKSKKLKLCRLKCAERFTLTEQAQCFENYWKLGSRDRRAAFISKSVTILPKKSQITSSRTSNRDCYCKYMLEICNQEKPVCKECLCNILGETKGFLNVVIEKKKLSPNGIVDEDERGRKPPKNKKSIEDLKLVKDHILSFPSYESHYCRKSTGKKYLSVELSIAKMYREYKNTSPNPVSLKLYSSCFHSLNLSFKKPSKDICNTCDTLHSKIKIANEHDKINLMSELSLHQTQAEKAYLEKRVDKDIAKANSSFMAFTFDLQQCLPTPYLNTSVSFYKRQLWSFNLTVHDLATNEATCYMWDETIGARGANQIASCLWHFCNNLPSEVEEVTFYSDTCGGQNKNNVVAMMFLFLLNNQPTLQKINHKFLLSGHTHMECDSDHSIIERAKKKTNMRINHLNDWAQLVRTCKIQKPFKVVLMILKDFLNFSELKSKKGPFAIKKLDDSGEKFLWQPIKWLQYDKNHIGTLNYKDNLDRESDFKTINLKKRGKPTIQTFRLSQISQVTLPISVEKKKDLLDVLDLIDESFKDFYVQLKTVNDPSTSNIDPDLDEDNPDEEEEI